MFLSRSSENIVDVTCFSCLKEIEYTGQLLTTSCGHTFHWVCFNTKVSNRERCPVCKSSLQTSLHNLTVNTDTHQSTQSLPDATMPRTRNQQRLDEQESDNMAQEEPNAGASVPLNASQQVLIDAITASAARQTEMLAAVFQSSIQGLVTALSNNLRLDTPALPPSSEVPPQLPRSPISQTRISPTDSVIRLDRVSQIIGSWKLKFSGRSGLSVEDFLYRVEALTNQSLEGNFALLMSHISTLFEGCASDWYWRYHRRMPSVTWAALCDALRTQFKEERSDVSIRAEIHRRKQKEGESFDEFYESVVLLSDKLSVPLSDSALLESIRSNLLPEIQHELLYQMISTVPQLRHIIRTREAFMQTVKLGLRKPQPAPRRLVHEVAVAAESESEEDEAELAAVNISCWNCGKVGHRYQDCMSDRKVFCYGCGKADTYRPSCPQCCTPKNGQVRAPWKGARKPMISRATNTE